MVWLLRLAYENTAFVFDPSMRLKIIDPRNADLELHTVPLTAEKPFRHERANGACRMPGQPRRCPH